MYERLREADESSDTTDPEARAGLALDEENLADRDFELDPALADAMTSQSALGASSPRETRRTRETDRSRSKAGELSWMPQSSKGHEADEADDDVPRSLLVEDDQLSAPMSQEYPRVDQSQDRLDSVPVVGRATRSTRAKWQTTQEQQRLYQDPQSAPPRITRFEGANDPLVIADPRTKAMWRWANVVNLDNFLWEVYQYFIGNGIWSILLSRILNLL